MYKKVIGSILMILGTSVGAGMLALPIVTAHETFAMSLVLLFSSWLMMTIGAYSLLEVSLWLPPHTNMVSMADKTLGRFGKQVTWCIYLLLLYSLICAYLSGLSDIIQGLLAHINITIPRGICTLFGLGLFGTIVYRGISSVDLVNRGLMGVKLLAYGLLILLLFQHIDLQLINDGDYHWQNSAVMVMLTSFGYAIIIPSLRVYLDDNHALLKKVVLIGSLIPLLLYIVWIFVIQGIIAKSGSEGLISMMTADNTNSMLMNSLSATVHTTWSAQLVKLFISICAVTSFLGVSVCLTDFIADGLSIEKRGKSALVIYAITYLPPLFIVFLSPGIFVKALDYAGVWCLILLIMIPLWMLYRGRYRLGLSQKAFIPGKSFVLGSLFVSMAMLIGNIVHAYL